MTQFKVLDLFAGVGGFSYGLEQVKDSEGFPKFELYRAVDIDKYACQTLRNRYGDDKVIEGDITQLNISNQIIRECKGKVSVVVGGIPCQSFSLIGPRSGFGKKIDKFKQDIRDSLYKHFRDIVAELSPKIIAIENVKGILSKKDSEGKLIIDKIVGDFEALGYNLGNTKDSRKFMILNCADYGVPQRRERVILVGIKKDWKNAKVPFVEPTHFDPKSNDAEDKKEDGLLPYVSLFEAIGDLPKIEPSITFTDLSQNMRTRVKKKNKLVHRGQDKVNIDWARFEQHLSKISSAGKLFLNHVRPNGYKHIDHHIARSQQLTDIKLFSLMKEGETAKEFSKRAPKSAKKLIKYDMTSFLDKYRKQHSSSPSTTVFAHLEKDGNRFIHYNQARTFTPREVARIQSFPDDFIFSGPINKKFKQIGNAIPPLFSKAIAESLTNILT